MYAEKMAKELQKTNLFCERAYAIFIGLCMVFTVALLLFDPAYMILPGFLGLFMLVLLAFNRHLINEMKASGISAPTLIQNLLPFLFKNK